MQSEGELIFRSSNLPQRSFHFFEQMKKNNEFCDITFQVGSQSISAHRLIIASGIPYFRHTLSKIAVGQGSEDVTMPDVDPDAFKSLIEFSYSCEVKISMETVYNLLTVACLLHVDEVREACCDFLTDKLQPENVLNIHHVASDLHCFKLVESTDCYASEHFVQVSETEGFLNAPYSYVKDLIERDDLLVSSEEIVFEAAMKWVKQCPEDRKASLPELLRRIRMPLLKPVYLVDKVSTEEMIFSSVSCRNLLDEAKNYYLLPERRNNIRNFSTEPRKYLKNVPIKEERKTRLYKLNGGVKYTAQCFDDINHVWYTKECTPYYFGLGCGAAVNNKIYFFNRCKTLQYDVLTNCYKFVKDSLTSGYMNTAASLNNKIYVCGGKSGEMALNTLECYDPEKDEWTKLSPMRIGRWGASAVALNECIYVLGGTDDSSVFDSVEKYNIRSGKWQNVSPMLVKRAFLGCAALNGKIYACGGTATTKQESCVATAEMYDPVKYEWIYVKSMNEPKYRFILLPSCGKLYTVGDVNYKVSHAVEIYNPETDEWKLVNPSGDIFPLSAAAVVSVP